ncbi:MAG: transposase [Paracoccaceae bacterium]
MRPSDAGRAAHANRRLTGWPRDKGEGRPRFGEIAGGDGRRFRLTRPDAVIADFAWRGHPLPPRPGARRRLGPRDRPLGADRASARPRSAGHAPDELPPALHDHRPGRRATLAADPERRAVVEARFNRMTFEAVADAVETHFGERRLAKSAIHGWFKNNHRLSIGSVIFRWCGRHPAPPLGFEPVARLESRPLSVAQPERLIGAVGADPAAKGRGSTTRTYLGADVSKRRIDVSGQAFWRCRVAVESKALRAFARSLAHRDAVVTLEATGGYETPLVPASEAAVAAYARVNPARARHFARSIGQAAKTDRIDARMLAELGARLEPKPTEPAPARRALKAPAAHRPQRVEIRKREDTRLHQARDRLAPRSIRRMIAGLSAQIAWVEQEMAARIADDREIAADIARLQQAQGVGLVVAATLIAGVPELGRLNRQVAAPAGLARVGTARPDTQDRGAVARRREPCSISPRCRSGGSLHPACRSGPDSRRAAERRSRPSPSSLESS